MGTRLDLHDILIAIQSNAYFQPPESLKLRFPCIIYKKALIQTKHANNDLYSEKTRYQVTAIDKDPDSTWQRDILALPLCRHDRSFTTDGLNHDIFELYF